jgi:hypothetical protein
VSPNNPASTTTSPPKYAPLRLSLAAHSLPHFLHLYPHLFPSCPSLFSYKESQRFGEVEVQKLLKGKTELINFMTGNIEEAVAELFLFYGLCLQGLAHIF